MATTKKSLDSRQLSLLDLIQEAEKMKAAPREGALDVDRQFREVVSACLKACPLSRYQVAARMSELTGLDVTKTMLDSWTAESKEQHRFPAVWLPAFCTAVGSSEPLAFLGRPIGAYVLPGPIALRAEIQGLAEQELEIRKKKRKRMLFLREMEGDK